MNPRAPSQRGAALRAHPRRASGIAARPKSGRLRRVGRIALYGVIGFIISSIVLVALYRALPPPGTPLMLVRLVEGYQSVAAPGSPQVIPKPLSRSQTAAAKPTRSTPETRAENQAGLVGSGSPRVLWWVGRPRIHLLGFREDSRGLLAPNFPRWQTASSDSWASRSWHSSPRTALHRGGSHLYDTGPPREYRPVIPSR